MSYNLVMEDRASMKAAFQINDSDDVIELPIVKLYDCDGDYTDDWSKAQAYICGSGDLWITMRIISNRGPVFH